MQIQDHKPHFLDGHDTVRASAYGEDVKIFPFADEGSARPDCFVQNTKETVGLDEDIPSPHGPQAHWPGFSLVFPSIATAQIDLCYCLYGESYLIIHSKDTKQRKIQGSAPNLENVFIWQQVHAAAYSGLLIHNLENLQRTGLIVSIADG